MIKSQMEFGNFKVKSIQECLCHLFTRYFFRVQHCSFLPCATLLLYTELCFLDSLPYPNLKVDFSILDLLLQVVNDRQDPFRTFAAVSQFVRCGGYCSSGFHILCLPRRPHVWTAPGK